MYTQQNDTGYASDRHIEIEVLNFSSLKMSSEYTVCWKNADDQVPDLEVLATHAGNVHSAAFLVKIKLVIGGGCRRQSLHHGFERLLQISFVAFVVDEVDDSLMSVVVLQATQE